MFSSYPFGYPTRRERYLQALAEQEERQRYEQALRQRQQMLRQRQYEEALREQEYQEALRQRHLQQALRQRQQEEALEQQRRARRSYAQEELDPFYSMLFGEPSRASRFSRSRSPEVQHPQPQSTSGDASPAASPKHSPSPSPAPAPVPPPTPSASNVDLDTPASLIQSTWRTHRSLATVSRILSKFDALRSSFSFPTTLDFDPSTHALLYTPTNAPLRAYEHALGKILEELDAVESWGIDKVRKERRRAVKVIESDLGALDEKKKQLERETFMAKDEVEAVNQEQEMAVDEPTQDTPVESALAIIQDDETPATPALPASQPTDADEPMPAADVEEPAPAPVSEEPALAADAEVPMHDADVEVPAPSSDIIDHPIPDAASIPLPSLDADEVPLPESDTEDNASLDDEDDEVLMELFESARSSPEMVHVALPELEDVQPVPVPGTHIEHKVVEQMLDPTREVDGFELL